MIDGAYQVKAEPPFTPGSEFAGVVAASAHGFEKGERVFGSMFVGAFAERVHRPPRRPEPHPGGHPHQSAPRLSGSATPPPSTHSAWSPTYNPASGWPSSARPAGSASPPSNSPRCSARRSSPSPPRRRSGRCAPSRARQATLPSRRSQAEPAGRGRRRCRDRPGRPGRTRRRRCGRCAGADGS
ncbi:hypothetical protein ACRAWF_21095 [Streptomyces sp. L7]